MRPHPVLRGAARQNFYPVAPVQLCDTLAHLRGRGPYGHAGFAHIRLTEDRGLRAQAPINSARNQHQHCPNDPLTHAFAAPRDSEKNRFCPACPDRLPRTAAARYRESASLLTIFTLGDC